MIYGPDHMSKCAIVGEKAIRDLIARYEGKGSPLTNDEREILLFHLYNERRKLRGKVVILRDTIQRRIKGEA
jgi:hypothetical protein